MSKQFDEIKKEEAMEIQREQQRKSSAAAPQVVADERALEMALEALTTSRPKADHYQEPLLRHAEAIKACVAALAAAPVQAQEPVAGKPCPYCGSTDGAHDKAYPHPRAPVQPVAVPDGLKWRVRERRSPTGELLGCFVEAPQEGDWPYALEVLGDDYNGYGGIERRYQHCQMIVGWANAAPAAQGDAKELTDDQIKEVAINYASHVAGDVYDVTKYDCPEDFFNCVRAAIAAKSAS